MMILLCVLGGAVVLALAVLALSILAAAAQADRVMEQLEDAR